MKEIAEANDYKGKKSNVDKTKYCCIMGRGKTQQFKKSLENIMSTTLRS